MEGNQQEWVSMIILQFVERYVKDKAERKVMNLNISYD